MEAENMVIITDNLLRYNAVCTLYEQAKKLFSQKLENISKERFYDELVFFAPIKGLKLHQIKKGPDEGKLTLEGLTEGGKWSIVPGITPVNYINLVRQGESIEQAGNRLYG